MNVTGAITVAASSLWQDRLDLSVVGRVGSMVFLAVIVANPNAGTLVTCLSQSDNTVPMGPGTYVNEAGSHLPIRIVFPAHQITLPWRASIVYLPSAEKHFRFARPRDIERGYDVPQTP